MSDGLVIFLQEIVIPALLVGINSLIYFYAVDKTRSNLSVEYTKQTNRPLYIPPTTKNKKWMYSNIGLYLFNGIALSCLIPLIIVNFNKVKHDLQLLVIVTLTLGGLMVYFNAKTIFNQESNKIERSLTNFLNCLPILLVLIGIYKFYGPN